MMVSYKGQFFDVNDDAGLELAVIAGTTRDLAKLDDTQIRELVEKLLIGTTVATIKFGAMAHVWLAFPNMPVDRVLLMRAAQAFGRLTGQRIYAPGEPTDAEIVEPEAANAAIEGADDDTPDEVSDGEG